MGIVLAMLLKLRETKKNRLYPIKKFCVLKDTIQVVQKNLQTMTRKFPSHVSSEELGSRI